MPSTAKELYPLLPPRKVENSSPASAQVNSEEKLASIFDAAISAITKYTVLTPLQQQSLVALRESQNKMAPDRKEDQELLLDLQRQTREIVIPKQEQDRRKLIISLIHLKDKVVNDKQLTADKALAIANSTKELTKDLTNSATPAQQLQAIKKFADLNAPISKKHIALAAVIGAVIGAAVVVITVLTAGLGTVALGSFIGATAMTACVGGFGSGMLGFFSQVTKHKEGFMVAEYATRLVHTKPSVGR